MVKKFVGDHRDYEGGGSTIGALYSAALGRGQVWLLVSVQHGLRATRM